MKIVTANLSETAYSTLLAYRDVTRLIGEKPTPLSETVEQMIMGFASSDPKVEKRALERESYFRRK